MADLNHILENLKKIGGATAQWNKYRIFKNFLAQTSGVDMGMSGGFLLGAVVVPYQTW